MSENTQTALDLDIQGLILKGIANAKGSPEAIMLITENDCLKLGEELANREAYRKTQFFSVVVEPINNIEEGKKLGNYDAVYDWISVNTVPLQKAEGAKRIYFVPVNETIPEGKEAEFLAKFGKKPVTNAPNYLLGAMAKLKESDLPENLKLKDFVAVSADDREVFAYKNGNRCFLYCYRGDGERELAFVELALDWFAGYSWVLLAEDLEPSE